MNHTNSSNQKRASGDARSGGLAWAAILIFGSSLLLAYNLDLLHQFGPIVGFIVVGTLALSGLAFLASVVVHPSAWWRLIPGWILLALATMLMLENSAQERWVAAILFFGMGAAFINITLLNRSERWWALLPGGFMCVLGTVIGLSSTINHIQVLGAILFAGLGLVFLLTAMATNSLNRLWAQIPASILILFGLFILAGSLTGSAAEERNLFTWATWWPLAPLLIGVLMAWRTLATRSQLPRFKVQSAPRSPSPVPPALPTETPLAASSRPTASPQDQPQSLGEYSEPVPGASIEILPER